MRLFTKSIFLTAACFAALLAMVTNFANAQTPNPNPYLIENVPVNVSAKTPADARNLGVKTARRDAFLILLARISTDDKIANRISDDDISDMVRSEQITDEKIAGGNYSANFTISFAKDFVEHIVLQKSGKNADKAQPEEASDANRSYLVISAKVLKRKVLLWEGSNDWKAAMDKALKDVGDKNAKSVSGDIDDMAILNDDNVSQISYNELEPLFSKYKADVIYITTFSYDGITNKAGVTIRGFSKLRNTQTKLSFANSSNLSEQELLNKIAAKAAQHLAALSRGKPSNVGQELLELDIPVSKLGDWLMIKNRLERSNLITKMNIESISADHVKIAVTYNDTGVDMFEAFEKAGFVLSKNVNDSYLLIIK